MNDLNNVTLSGRLTRDVELKFLPSGTPVLNFGVASKRAYKKNDEWNEQVAFVEVAWFGAGAERYAETLQKGIEVVVDGSLQLDQWEQDGQKRSRLTVRANRLWIPHSYRKNAGNGNGNVNEEGDVPFTV